MKAKEAVFSRRDAETQREVLDRINRIDRIDGSGGVGAPRWCTKTHRLAESLTRLK